MAAYSDENDARQRATLVGKLFTIGWVQRKSNQEIFDDIERGLKMRSIANRKSPISATVHRLLSTID